MYGKIFDSMYDGTLVDDWRALVTFQQMIVLCDADGVIDMTPASLSRRTGIPIEHIKAGIQILENPDPYSRTEEEDGKRISLLDQHRPWGWYIVNHEKYKSCVDADTIRMQNRERKRKQRARDKMSRDVTDGHSSSRHTDTDTNTDTDIKAKDIRDISSRNNTRNVIPYQKIVDLFHETLPTLQRTEKLTATRKGFIRQRWLEDLKELEHWKNYFDYVAKSDFLMGRAKPSGDRKPFTATLEWLTRPGNYAKVAEGTYHV